MYLVLQQGRLVYRGELFVDAWLYIILSSQVYCTIIGPDGKWVINPMDGN
jgi:hypothetical protein